MEESELAEAMAKSSAEGQNPGSTSGSAGAGGLPGSGQALGANAKGASTSSSAPQPAASSTSTSSHSEEAIQTVGDDLIVVGSRSYQLMGLGTPREHALQLLDAAGGNVDMAAAMLFG